MSIDWIALAQVAMVTVLAAVAIVGVVSGGALMLDRAKIREGNGDGTASLVMIGWSMIGLAGLVVLYGLYLLIPYFH
ncbi:hypothetical protein [Acidipropionibacterium jensenii]|uniref:Uncharacterized protein n=1 Tax=Acidipropionibacterium jensenii TaxID=1749 RepID=A0A3Q9UM20_9ACTN|nr:hypothetical protein [Acidipropionibacterium jensenii]AZZ40141.1 hypothetical protein C0Z10_10705 [Acidipropionibacterium jensenii]AZZ41464.1 hypothetical protein C0Z11_03270 [Acidipropionibacterium jensenii]MDN5977882.1 hypothetical protein [Acidipropionibacterium jensenii]MDN5996658.1 hypothetical protein [Acidipropionibacterium jensenii]MDN6022002.1 hypothetical protein [Acidipropionibacterium jensenii]